VSAPTDSVVIVGAGVFGAVTALELRNRGYPVTLVDRGTVPHVDASSTDISKMVRMDYGRDVFYHELAEAALDGWDRWNADWPAPLYHAEGFLVLAPEPMRPGGFEYESHRVLRERGYEPERLDATVLAERFPAWKSGRYPDGYLSPRGGWAESGAVVARLLELCAVAGVTIRAGAGVAGLREGDAGVEGVRLDDGQAITASHVVVAAGAWTPLLVPSAAPLMRSVAQPVLHFGVEHPDDYRGPHFPPFAADISGTGWYGFPALDDGRLKLGHHGEGHEVDPNRRGEVAEDHVAHARAFLAESLPSLANAPLVGTRVCLYCDTVDGDLLIDRVPGHPGLVVASGGSGHGFKFAPVIGGIVADALEGYDNRWSHRFRWRHAGPPAREEARLHKSGGGT